VTWVKLEDTFLDHPKFLRAGPLAGYLCISGIAWAGHHRTDGFIPREQVRRLVDFNGCAHHCQTDEGRADGWLADPLVLAEELVKVGLWDRDGDDFRVHDFLDWQESKAEIEAVARGRRGAGRKGAEARWGASEVSVGHGTGHGTGHDASNGVGHGLFDDKGMPREQRTENRGQKEGSSDVHGETNPSGSSRTEVRATRASSVTEPLGFADWLAYHAERSGRMVPGVKTAHRRKLAEVFAALVAEGRGLEEFKLATDGVVSDPWRVEHRYDGFDNVLRKTKFGDLVENGRRPPPQASSNGRAEPMNEQLLRELRT
jgi:hypothetical protein